MAKGMFRTPEGQVMVESGNRQSTMSRALYKAVGYRPDYEKLELETASPAKGTLELHRDKKRNAFQRPCARGQNWLRDVSQGGMVESYDRQPKPRDDIVEAYKQKPRTR